MTGRVEVVGRLSGRRSWSDEEKLEILAEAFRPGVRVRDVIAADSCDRAQPFLLDGAQRS